MLSILYKNVLNDTHNIWLGR